MDQRRRTGLPDVDALIDVAEREQATFDEVVVVNQAEDVVTSLRQQELVDQQHAAFRRLAAAKGLLTKAQKDGAAARIAAARRRVEDAYAEFDRISEANITELQALSGERLAGLGEMLEQMKRASQTSAAVTEALARQRPPR